MTAVASEPKTGIAVDDTTPAISVSAAQHTLQHIDASRIVMSEFIEGRTAAAGATGQAAEYKDPWYALPGGVFAEAYRGGAGLTRFYLEFNNGERSLSPLVVPPYANIEWKASALDPKLTPPADSISWSYNYAVPNGVTADVFTNTVEKSATFTLPGMAYGQAYSSMKAPVLTFGSGDSIKRYNTNSHLMTMPRQYTDHLSFVRFNPNAVNNKSYTEHYSLDSLYVTAYTNYVVGAYKGFGFYIPKPQATYGFDGVMLSAVILKYESRDLRFSVYEVYGRAGSSTSTGGTLYQYNIGERLGGGYIKREDITPSNNYQTLFIPCKETMGEYELESYINVDCDIAVIFEGYKNEVVDNTVTGDVFAPVMMVGYNPLVEPEGVFRYQGRASSPAIIYSSNLMGFYGYENIVVSPHYCGSGIRLLTGNLAANEDADYYTFEVPTEGGSKTFDFEPSESLEINGIVTGKGLYDWYEYEVGTLNETTGLQTLTVKVNALPEGVSKRTARMKVSIPGADQVIKITQGNASGIDSVTTDATVTGSRYFDMTGRELNAEPASGLYIRRDVMSDGTTTSVKVVK